MITHLSSTKPKEEELNDTDTPDLHDRVYDAYYGKLGKKFMHETQRRINWICSQVTGNRVLDIGCSQGISSILLGREGKEVTGIDVDSTAINSAQNHLSHESRPVRENIKFLNADAANHTFDTKAFDTVILSEILEHLINPERIIRVASEQLCLGGKLVVTIPFGINDYIDHKKTFYLLEPYQIISKHFKIVDVLVIGHWLGIVAVDEKLESDKIRPPSFTSQLINKLEEGFLDIEQELRNELATTKNKLHDANLKYRSSTERLTSDRKKLTEEKSARARVETNHKLIESQLEKSERIIHLERLNSVESQKSLTRSETNLARFKDDAEKYKKSHNKSKTRIKGLKNHLLESKKDIKARKERAKKINNKLQSLQQNNIKANNKVTMLEDHIEALVLNAQKDTEITTKLEDQLFVINKDLARAKETILELQESLSLSQLDTNKYENLQLDLDKSSKKTKATKEQVNNLSSELDILKSHEREQHSKLARSKAEAIRNRIDISQSHDQIESLRQQIQIANQQVAKTRATLSFQLGHALIFSPKSIGNLKSLPGKLWTLHKEAKIRRSKRKALPFHKPLVTALQTNFAPTAESTDQAPKRAVNLKLVSSQPSNLPEILKALKVATIMDEFTYGSYQDECNLLQLTPQHWQKELASFRQKCYSLNRPGVEKMTYGEIKSGI
jgi:SAM-dependent methyltransferase